MLTMPISAKVWPFTFNFIVGGGPFSQCPDDFFGVCLKKEATDREITRAILYGHYMPIQDFDTPTIKQVEEGLRAMFLAHLNGGVIYVGCMGGTGRTGLILALFAKAAGVEGDMVKYVRNNYKYHAVETEEQRVFLERYGVRGIRRWLFWRLVWRKLRLRW